MEDNKNDGQNTTEEKVLTNGEKAIVKLAAVKAVKLLAPDSKWTILQDMLQEILATHIVVDPASKPSASVMAAELKAKVEEDYEEDAELKQMLLDAIPSKVSISKWTKKSGWQEAIWDKIKGRGQFSNERRTSVMNALYQKAINGGTAAAKIWLTLSGDYQEKAHDEGKDKTLETFREINNLLHKKSNTDK